MELSDKIYVAGHTGLVGSAIMRNLRKKGYNNFLLRTIEELDLTNQALVNGLFEEGKPGYVIIAAARVGGIVANNTYRAQFLYDNLQIQNNIMHAAYTHKVKKLLFLGSSCIYPKLCPQPMKEEYLLSGELEYTNEPYAIAKIAGIKMCEAYNIQYGTNFLSAMPTNLYGPNDNYDLEKSHVLPALIRKMHLGRCLEENNWNGIRKDLASRPVEGVDGEAPDDRVLEILKKYGVSKTASGAKVILWGSGTPRREFLHSDDLADALVFIMNNIDFHDLAKGDQVKNTHINIGTGKDQTIKELADLIRPIVGYKGEIVWDTTKPDGTPRKLLDVNKIHSLGWKESISLEEGITRIYHSYIE
jgi:GDP-L-fucose synthase